MLNQGITAIPTGNITSGWVYNPMPDGSYGLFNDGSFDPVGNAGTFVAPVAGRYHLTASFNFQILSSIPSINPINDLAYCCFLINNLYQVGGNYLTIVRSQGLNPPVTTNSIGMYTTVTLEKYIQLAQGDTVNVRFNNENASNIWTLRSDLSGVPSTFAVVRVG